MGGTASERKRGRKTSSPRRGAGSAADVTEGGPCFDAYGKARYNRATLELSSRGLRRWPHSGGRHTTTSHRERALRQPDQRVANRLSVACGEALPTVRRNGPIDDGTTVDAFPGVENEERNQRTVPTSSCLHFWTFHVSSWVVTFTAEPALKQELHQNVKSIYFNSLYAGSAIHEMSRRQVDGTKMVRADIFCRREPP